MFPIWYDDDEDVDRGVLAWCNVFGFGVSQIQQAYIILFLKIKYVEIPNILLSKCRNVFRRIAEPS